MVDWMAIAGLILAGSISPGPNNALALRAGLDRDIGASLAVVAGVQVGCLVLLALCWLGLLTLLQAHPLFAPALTVAGAVYLAWLGLSLIRTAGAVAGEGHRPVYRSLWAVAWLQFLNPKAWILVATVAAATAGGLDRLAMLAALFVAISCASLLLWSAAGAQMARWLSRPERRVWFDRAMGLLLILSAVTLIVSDLRGSI